MSKLTKVKYSFQSGESAEFERSTTIAHTWNVRLQYRTGDVVEMKNPRAGLLSAKKLLNWWREDKA